MARMSWNEVLVHMAELVNNQPAYMPVWEAIRAKLVENLQTSNNKKSTPCSCASCGSPVDMPLCDTCIKSVVIG
jgi:hypothetical protein